MTIFLTPFLPYLVLGGTEAAKEVGKKFGEATWEKAKSLWSKTKKSVQDTAMLEAFATALAKTPNEIFQTSLAQMLADQFERSPELATELMNLMQDDDTVQKILIAQESTAKNIRQKLSTGGIQDVTVRGKSQVGNITQEQ